MSEKVTIEKRRGGSTLLIIFLILGLALLFFVFITKKMDIRLINKASASIEKGIDYRETAGNQTSAPSVNPRLVSMIYVTNDGKLSSCFVQVINAREKNIFLVEVPLNARLSLSTELYKDLLTFAPTLPQFVKLSRTCNYFSDNYRYEACSRILSENLGIKIDGWAAMNEVDFKEFTSEKSKGTADYYETYKKYANLYRNSQTSKERWAYYEIYSKSNFVDKATIPGQWDKTDYNINVVQARELIEELKY